MNKLEELLKLYLVKKAPAKGGRDFIVSIAPWLVISGLVVVVPRLISLLRVITMMAGSSYGGAVGMGLGPVYYLSITLASDLSANPLHKRLKKSPRSGARHSI